MMFSVPNSKEAYIEIIKILKEQPVTVKNTGEDNTFINIKTVGGGILDEGKGSLWIDIAVNLAPSEYQEQINGLLSTLMNSNKEVTVKKWIERCLDWGSLGLKIMDILLRYF